MSDHTPERGGPGGSSDSFVELVRDALLHLYDLTYLQTHPLVNLCAEGTAARVGGKALRQSLLDAIGAIHPGPGVSVDSRAWRSYRILELRYVVGSEIDDVLAEVTLSRRQYHREHHRALQAVASLLWESWRPTEARIASMGLVSLDPVGDTVAELTRHEAERLFPDEGRGQIDPSDVLRGVGDLLRPLGAQLGVSLQLEFPDSLPSLRGDRVALRQALLSILTPLFRAESSRTIRISVVHQPGPPGQPGRIEARVETDRGGAREQYLKGLEQSRPFVEALRGSIDCLPCPGPSDAVIIRLTFPTSDRPMLLVVDNNDDFIRLVERYLADYDWDVVGASDVEQAYSTILSRRPAAVLLDVVLPGRDGWDLLLRLKASPEARGTPVIICSVLREAEMATSLGAAAYLCKPIDQRQLVSALGLVLG